MIDKATIERIIDAADIVEVVSDFVSLKRRGSNYVGLCPFHNEKTPSFSVSKSKGICHCFSCGKGGSPVNFIMEHEQLSYYEALKYLANKYHIEVHERELTDKERAEQSERESMLIINESACKIFEDNLNDTPDGRDIGLAYFNQRGFSQQTIKKFRLGYSLDGRSDLYNELTSRGYNRQRIFDTGLCIEDRHGGGFDRFKGRVMFPVLNIAGKIIAFGGRTLKNDPAKYVNSPESLIYKKSNELYGLYQAKQAIVKKDKCFLVEGYADVISMHQSGFENTVASSGTSLTNGQIRLIHRFTENVTVLYDGDAAGIKASLRSIDLLLAEGLNIKVLLLPDGDDPDSFSRKHSTTEIEEYIAANEADFIQFKIRILLEGTGNDPIKKVAVINDVVQSIAVIPSNISRSVYIKECSRQLDIDEQVIIHEIDKVILKNHEKEFEAKRKADNAATKAQQEENSPSKPEETNITNVENGPTTTRHIAESSLYPYEREITKYVAKYGMSDFCDVTDSEGNTQHWSVLQYITSTLTNDGINISDTGLCRVIEAAKEVYTEFDEAYSHFIQSLEAEMSIEYDKGIGQIKSELLSLEEIKAKENALSEKIADLKDNEIALFKTNFIEKKLCSSPDDLVRNISSDLVSEKHNLSKIHTVNSPIRTESDRLIKLIPEAINNLKSAIISCRIKELQNQLPLITDPEQSAATLDQLKELYSMRSKLAKYIGDRVVNPHS